MLCGRNIVTCIRMKLSPGVLIASDLAAGSERVRVRTGKSRYKRHESVQVVVRLADQQGAPVLDAAVEVIATRADEQRFTTPLVADDETLIDLSSQPIVDAEPPATAPPLLITGAPGSTAEEPADEVES